MQTIGSKLALLVMISLDILDTFARNEGENFVEMYSNCGKPCVTIQVGNAVWLLAVEFYCLAICYSTTLR